jgi:catechol 2,3-dioxygenase-like lactoylglutathione lyase family enzyme
MAIKSFEIISVPVSDQQRSKQFYRDVTSFQDPDRNGWILRQPPA